MFAKQTSALVWAGRILQQLSLAWRSLPEKKFVKAANAVAKLDLGKELWAKPLKVALEAWLPRMNGRHLANLKAIAVMELLDEPQAMHAYLEQCESLRNDIWYSRHLQVVEAHVHLLYPELWNSLDERIRLFLQTVRTAAEESRQTQAQVQERSASENSEDESDEEVQAAVAPTFDKQRFSSALHADISRMLTALGLEHSNKISAGPVLLDIVRLVGEHLPSMVVVEAAAPWQYYLRSPQITALARRRQEMISAMGFNLQVIPYFRWDTLKDDSAKAELLKKQLPKESSTRKPSRLVAPMSVASRVHRFKALQDVLAALVVDEDDVAGAVQDVPRDLSREAMEPQVSRLVGTRQVMASEVALASLSTLLPDSVIQQALALVDSKSIHLVTSQLGRKAYEVRGQKASHFVLARGLYCSCPYFGRRVIEAGELCCKHWLAVQVAQRCGTGIGSSECLQEDEFLDWSRQRMLGCQPA
ncbi:ZSWIM7 [Symbiodinium microadriaticum]|nr:ZSWIM7 [Symbiodinium sp. KB8]CAE7210582.1 ZSWIM7 [Symbiodinium microadriaticum]